MNDIVDINALKYVINLADFYQQNLKQVKRLPAK